MQQSDIEIITAMGLDQAIISSKMCTFNGLRFIRTTYMKVAHSLFPAKRTKHVWPQHIVAIRREKIEALQNRSKYIQAPSNRYTELPAAARHFALLVASFSWIVLADLPLYACLAAGATTAETSGVCRGLEAVSCAICSPLDRRPRPDPSKAG